MKINNINNEVEKTMNCLNNWQPLQADPFFATRTLNKLNKTKHTTKTITLSYILKAAIIITVLFINSATLEYYLISKSNSTDNSSNDLATLITNEYSMEGYNTETNYIFE